MEDLLFLAHRVPYPPNKGDKIRSFHLLQFLAERYRVHLGCFVDAPEDFEAAEALYEWVADLHRVRIDPRRRRVSGLARSLLGGGSISRHYYADRRMQRFVDRKRAEGARLAVAFSSPMCQFLEPCHGAFARRIADFVDVDSLKWAQYADSKPWPVAPIYRLEHRRLAADEARWSDESNATLFVSEEEAELFRGRHPNARAPVHAVGNGVDLEFFDPGLEFGSPYGQEGPNVVFVGAMDYWANVDAVVWFAEAVWPRLRAQVTGTRFFIVGMRPAAEVRRLGEVEGIHVTGAVDDVRPYVAHADCVVAPLRIARGVQNKVLEALAMARPVCASRFALEGLALPAALHREICATEAEETVHAVAEHLARPQGERPHFRRFVKERYSWAAQLARVSEILEDDGYA